MDHRVLSSPNPERQLEEQRYRSAPFRNGKEAQGGACSGWAWTAVRAMGEARDKLHLGCTMLCCMRKEENVVARRKNLARGLAALDWERTL